MNSGRSDASTSTDDDLKSRPLCLFYFTHPFGVLSPEPPVLATAPPHVARAFLNMRPLDAATADLWRHSPPAAAELWRHSQPSTAAPTTPSPDTDDTLHFDLGNATVHRAPLALVTAPKARKYTLDFDLRTTSSSFFSSDVWPSSSSRSYDSDRRVIPYNRILPPLQMPTPKDVSDCSDDYWPIKCLNPEKFSLPPIELPKTCELESETCQSERTDDWCDMSCGVRSVKCKSTRSVQCGVRKQSRRARHRRSGVRRMLTQLMRRTLRYRKECNTSPALQELLNTIREAWTEPTLLLDRCRASVKASAASLVLAGKSACDTSAACSSGGAMLQRSQLAELSALPGASPGLLRRRYSVPETIMRKYRLAQQRSECESAGQESPASACQRRAAPVCGCESPPGQARCSGGGGGRRAALLRRLWARPPPCGCGADAGSREARSLGCSRAEIACSSPGPGWATPKRQRLDDDMLRAAMRNSYDDRKSRGELSDSTFQSHSQIVSSPVTASMERLSDVPRRTRDVFAQYSECSAPPPAAPPRVLPPAASPHTPNSPTFNSIPPTAPTYELLEIVVSETLSCDTPLAINVSSPERKSDISSGGLTVLNGPNLDIDEYVSNILVESLNSLTDQLESMNASIGGDRKISIVEKEIKVKLQNTGVNTIVHLSPTSNNQIIFGNEELCHADERRDSCNNVRSMPRSADTNENLTSADMHNEQTPQPESLVSLSHQDNVNRVVLQQIQKLFQEELDNFEPSETPDISHIEISNVDVYIEEADDSEHNINNEQLTVGGGNYFPSSGPLVPRMSALPQSASMEVNTSSSDGDSGPRVSDCTSLVDSLDDPASPRVDLLSCHEYRNAGLAHSAADVLELLPHSDPSDRSGSRGEAFFIRIRDDDCDCEKENVVVADHMPEKIKQRLYRRHRRRELRMECARRSRMKQIKRDFEKQRTREVYRSKREIDRECSMTLNTLIDEVIAKIAQDEYKCMRIKRRQVDVVSKSTENLARRNRRKELERTDSRESMKVISNGNGHFTSKRSELENFKSKRRQIRGRLSLHTQSSPVLDERGPKRVYQKSEIHDGNKRIEILEILEYVDSSQSSPDTTTSDENHNCSLRNKKSRIPIPISERINKLPRASSQSVPSLDIAQAVPGIVAPRRASLPQEARFRHVFDAIPEERSSLSLDSADDAPPRRLSAPTLASDPAPTSPSAVTSSHNNQLANSPKRRPVRSTATSPLIDADKKTKLKSQTTMTSPCKKSAATSPMRRFSPDSRVTSGVTTSATTSCTSGVQTSGTVSSQTTGTRTSASRTSSQTTSGGAASGVGVSGSGVSGNGTSGGRRGLASRGRAWLGFAHAHEEGSRSSKEKAEEKSKQTKLIKSVSTQYDTNTKTNKQCTVRTMHSVNTDFITFGQKNAKSEKSNKTESKKVKEKLISKKSECDSKYASSKSNVKSKTKNKKNNQVMCLEKSEEEREVEAASGDSSSESESSLLCARWLAPRRSSRRRRHRLGEPREHADAQSHPGNWSVTVAGSCRAALPADVEMRLRFPDRSRRGGTAGGARAAVGGGYDVKRQQQQESSYCQYCSDAPRLPPAPSPGDHCKPGKLTFTMKKEALDSSILASKTRKKSSEPLPELETYRSTRTKTNRSVKARRGYSLHCWLPTTASSHTRSRNGLSVSGCAIVPELKPRAPTMSERDLTRLYTPRLYLRS